MVGEFAGFPHEGFVLQVFTCYLLVNVLKANEERPVAEPERERSTSRTWRCGVAGTPPRLIPAAAPLGLPWGLRLGHPHEVHVAGQQGEVRRVSRAVGTAEVAVGQQDVDDQLQVGFPSDRLPEQNHSWD